MSFSKFFTTKTVDYGDFSVTYRQIPNGDYIDLQKRFFGDVHLSKDKHSLDQQLEKKRISFPDFNAELTLLGIEGWTLTNDEGELAPKDMKTWHALPKHLIEEFEKEVEALNPREDEDFQD